MHPTPFRRPTVLALLALAALVLAGPQAFALDVRHMDLGELCDRADKIFRGTVVSVTDGTVEAGGAELPTTTYAIEVSDLFKGEVTAEKDGVRIIEITTLGSFKSAPAADGTVRLTAGLAGLPQLEVGGDYLLMTTAASAVNLSTTVGLGQGCFDIVSHDKVEMAADQAGNIGPVAYTALADEIRSLLGQ